MYQNYASNVGQTNVTFEKYQVFRSTQRLCTFRNRKREREREKEGEGEGEEEGEGGRERERERDRDRETPSTYTILLTIDRAL
jgi:hypothetical protein